MAKKKTSWSQLFAKEVTYSPKEQAIIDAIKAYVEDDDSAIAVIPLRETNGTARIGHGFMPANLYNKMQGGFAFCLIALKGNFEKNEDYRARVVKEVAIDEVDLIERQTESDS